MQEAESLLLKNGLLWPKTAIKINNVPEFSHDSLTIYESEIINAHYDSAIYLQGNKLLCERERAIELWSIKSYPPQLIKKI